ncbi:EAL domain-containing protein [Aquibacillus albus]|uniref:Diguanylate cyclase (GGDEF)-like protein/PAS domain S-box-containing protein n=1 Tax=Aquibacillus albus TaxID=1168171 RepID=A0ABS2MW36_9BACI|nr:EAL domain-containing protein [Aquibacillus albus]MBM7570114.1 diguanylate cyclase (GGDEF)-like protein/PAS domain S-box-containing protein [Aquibacillus albus]
MNGTLMEQASMAFTGSLFDDFSDGVILIDDKNTMLYVNPTTTQLLGYQANDLVDKPIDVIFPTLEQNKPEHIGVTKKQANLFLHTVFKDCTIDEDPYTLIILKKADELKILHRFFEKIANKTGEVFLNAAVEFLTNVFEVDAAIVGKTGGENRFETLASYHRKEDAISEEVLACLADEVLDDLENGKKYVYRDHLDELSSYFYEVNWRSCVAVPIYDKRKKVQGLITMIDHQTMVKTDLAKEVMNFLSYRLSAEMERIKYERTMNESKKRYQEIIESSPESIYIYSNDEIVFANDKGIQFLGGESMIDIVGLDLLQFAHPDFREFFKVLLKQSLELNKQSTTVEGQLVGLHHHVHDVEVTVIPYHSMDQDALQVVIKDVTERKQAENFDSQLRIRKQKTELLQLIKNRDINNGKLDKAYEVIAESAANSLGIERVSIWMYDKSRYALHCKDMFEWSKNSHTSGANIDLEDNPHYMVSIEKDSLITVHDVYKEIGNKNIYKPFLDHSVSSFMDAPIRVDGRVVGIVNFEHIGMPRQWTYDEQSFATSIADLVELAIEKSERKRVEKKVEHLAYYDQLTKLPNRIYLFQKLQEFLEDAKQNKHQFAVLYFDLDQFKNINDSLGHSFGDQLLTEVAQRIKGCIRQIDLFARMGGDEFILILPRIRKKEDVAVVAERIIKAFKAPIKIDESELYITTSIGISVFPDDGKDEETLIKHADIAMYEAKAKSRNGYCNYSSSMNEDSVERLLMETNLNKALERKEFVLLYQPIIELNNNKIVAAEALIRWQHPDLGLIPPARFIPLAEETGLIKPIGYWVIRTVCEQLKLWQKQYGMQDFRIAVNISAIQFEDEDFIEKVKQILQETNVHPSHLEFEITESVMQNIEKSMAILGELRTLGIHVSLDDFGTGYSSLSILKHLPINNIKIDKSFIDDVKFADDETIVQNIIDMSQNMKFKVVAEGIENEIQLNFLREKQCDYGQGYFFNMPLPVLDFEKKLV